MSFESAGDGQEPRAGENQLTRIPVNTLARSARFSPLRGFGVMHVDGSRSLCSGVGFRVLVVTCSSSGVSNHVHHRHATTRSSSGISCHGHHQK